jgi:hypothetical protein
MQSLRCASMVLSQACIQSGQQVRAMSAHASPEQSAKYMKLWTYTTYAALPVLIGLGVHMMSQPHDHHDQPHYCYLKKRDRKFPWGTNCDLFDFRCGQEHSP